MLCDVNVKKIRNVKKNRLRTAIGNPYSHHRVPYVFTFVHLQFS